MSKPSRSAIVQKYRRKSVGETAVPGSTVSADIATPPGTEISPREYRRALVAKRQLPRVVESRLVDFHTPSALMFRLPSALREAEDTDPTNVANAKIDNAIKQHDMSISKAKHATSTFGLQDESDNIIKVTINREQADEFESRLNSLLADGKGREIAEILYMIKDDFDILNIDWAEEITEDEESSTRPFAARDDKDEDLAAMDDIDSTTDDTDASSDDDSVAFAGKETSGEADFEKQTQTVDLLRQIIDLLKQEAELRAEESKLNQARIQAETERLNREREEQEINHNIELANAEQYESEQREKNKLEKIAHRIARYRASQSRG